MGFFDSLKSNVERLKAASSVAELKKTREAEKLINALKNESPDSRYGAVTALEKIGEPAVEPLIRTLKAEGANVGVSAAEILGAIGGRRAVEALIEALHDGKPNSRKNAARALGNTGDELIVKRHLQAVRDREPAVWPLVRALRDNEPEVRKGAATALGNIGDDRAIEPLIQSLKDISPAVQAMAAAALVKMGKPAMKLLIQTQEDGDSTLRNLAAEVLDKISGKQIRPERTEGLLKALVFNIEWSGELGWMLDEAFKAKGLTAPELNDIEYIDNFPPDEPERMAKKGASQLRKPGWSCIVDEFTLDLGGRKSHIIVYKG